MRYREKIITARTKRYASFGLYTLGVTFFLASLGEIETITWQPIWTLGCISLASLFFMGAEKLQQ